MPTKPPANWNVVDSPGRHFPGGEDISEVYRKTVAVVIPTYNAESLLRDCLESVKWVDQIIVVDMFSTDRTPELCAQYPNLKFYQRRDYIFGNVNFGFDQAETDWVIRLDSDERIREELKVSIIKALENDDPRYTGYWFRSDTYVFGRLVRWGPYTNTWRKHMFRRGAARYGCRSEHEDLETSGEWERLQGHYDHLNYASASQFVTKTNYYTDRDVERLQKVERPSAWGILYRTVKLFIWFYLRNHGYRDGLPGFMVCGLRAVYHFVEEVKRWEAWDRRQQGAN